MSLRKVKKCFVKLLLLCLVFLNFSCDYGLSQFLSRADSLGDRIISLNNTDLPSPTTEDSYSVAIITDVHFGGKSRLGHPDDKFLSYIQENKDSEKIKFVICLGDIVEHGWEEEYKEYASFVQKIESILGEKTVYTTVGNHDLYNNGWQFWKKYVNTEFLLDSSFFTFKTKNFYWYFIDSASGTLGSSQFKYLKSKMQNDEGPKLVFSHYPVYAGGGYKGDYFTMQNSDETSRLIALCDSTDTKLFNCGHTHRAQVSNFGSFSEINYPGFLSKNKWGLLKIDETNCTVEFENEITYTGE